MPTRWTEQAKFNLLLKIVEQNSNVKIDFNNIANDWPGPETFTARACEEQWKLIKKSFGLKTKVSKVSSTPPTPAGPKFAKTVSTNNTPMKPLTTPTKRSTTTPFNTPTLSVKKRKLKHSVQEAEETNIEETSESDTNTPLANTPNLSITTTATRTLPARSKSRSKSYAMDNNSAGEDAGAKVIDSDEDEEFDLVKDAASKLTKKERSEKRWSQYEEQQQQLRNAKIVVDGATKMEVKMEADAADDDADDDVSEVASRATNRISWKSALEQQVEDFDEV